MHTAAMNADYDYLMKIIVAGNSGSGKSSLLQQYVDKTFNENFIATIGVDFKIKNINLTTGKVAKMQIWDTAGQERFRTIVASYWRGADGVVFVYDVTDPSSFASVRQWAEEVDRYANPRVQKILVGNKCDLESKRVVSFDQGQQLANSMGIKYIETSAKTTKNVSEAFQLSAETVATNYQATHGLPNKPIAAPAVLKPGQKVQAESSMTCCSLM